MSLLLALLLAGCATPPPLPRVSPETASVWQAALPHQGSVDSLAQWWQRQGDPLLVELIEAAQVVSPSVSQALTRIETSRASLTSADAALLPSLNLLASASRGVSQPAVPLANTVQVGVQAAWELDWMGANRGLQQAAQAQLAGSQAQWHDARVSVAAEVANLYYSHASCKRLLALAKRDADSRAETARLNEISARAGLVAPALAALARASAADGRSRVTSQASLCELDLKALVALTAMAESGLREKLALAQTQQAHEATFSIASVPAQTIAQRPDIFAAERDVQIAAAQVNGAQAQHWPRLSLNGSIGTLRLADGATRTGLTTWSFGPLAISLPIWDAGQRAANVQVAQAGYASAVLTYRAKVRQAVREVEDALVNLNGLTTRSTDASVAAQGYAESLVALQQRHAQGLASLMELEDARRSALAADSQVLLLALERQRAWVALYRAAGGGFTAAALAE